ncbi:MAG: CinA family nicotinamide mononucleotide deamidase-related protein [Pseudomonadota bacterium]
MRCEVVAIGTELLLGIINDTNSSWIGEQLAQRGVDSYFQVKVGDNFDRIEGSIRTALERSDAVICCGGLGPTQDDITRDVIAHIMGNGLTRDEAIAAEIQRRFEARGRRMAPNNLRQADVPNGATTIPEMPGTAPGLVCPVGDKVIYAMPGVPHEMKEMMQGTVLPDLQRRAGYQGVIRSRVLRTWGLSESGLAELLDDRINELDETGHATLAFQASGIEGIKVRITAKAADDASAVEVLDAEEAHLRPILTNAIFGIDDETMETAVLKTLREHGRKLAAVETLTGGILSSRLTLANPEMDIFKGATIKSMTDADRLAGEQSEALALRLAQEARDLHTADIGLSVVTPSASEEATPGTIIMGICCEEVSFTKLTVLQPGRERMRNYSVISVLDLLRKSIAAGFKVPSSEAHR